MRNLARIMAFLKGTPFYRPGCFLPWIFIRSHPRVSSTSSVPFIFPWAQTNCFYPSKMDEFKNSYLIDPATYDTRGLCPGMHARVHNDHKDTDLSIIGALEDWRELIGPVTTIYKGGLHQEYSSVPISLPECLPDRINIISYATEFGFLEDDTFENDDTAHGEGILTEAMGAIADMNNNRTTPMAGTPMKGQRSAKNARKIQAWIISKILSIDPIRGKYAMNAWKKFLEWGGGGAASKNAFDNLEAYLNYRFEDVGCRYWAGMIVFGCAIDLTEEEERISWDICRPGWVAFFMVNDVCSFDKEYRDAMKNGWKDVSNAIWVIAKERGIGLEEAKAAGAKLLNDLTAEFIKRIEDAKASGKYSKDLLRFMDAVYYSISGSLVWSVTCPRYNPDQQFNERQIEWMTHGIPDHLRRNDSMKSAAYQLQTGMQVSGLVCDFHFNLADLGKYQLPKLMSALSADRDASLVASWRMWLWSVVMRIWWYTRFPILFSLLILAGRRVPGSVMDSFSST